ncbi:MAG: helix-turn-helix domain-containing protein [Lachnospiraceae bacterium]
MNLQYFRKTLRKKLREQKLTLNSLALEADLSEDTLRSIIYGKSQDIKLSTMIKIADVLNCSLDDLVERSGYSSQEQNMINRICHLPQRSRNIIEFVLELEERSSLSKSTSGKDIIPVFIPTGNLRDGMFYDSSSLETLDISEYPQSLKNNTDFGIRIKSFNYEPIYYPNDILLISHRHLPEYNDTVLYIDNSGKIYIRIYSIHGLVPVNDFGKIIPIKEKNNYKALGIVLRVVKEFDIEQYR